MKHGGQELTKKRGFRCLIAALFVAGVTTALVNVFSMVAPTTQPALFLLLLGVSFIAAQIHERMVKEQS